MSEIYDLNKILMIGLKYMKEINEEENEITLRENLRNGIDDGSLTENDVVDESNDVNLIKLRFKEYLKEKLEAFQIETSSDKTKSKDLSIKLKKFLQSSIYI